MSEEDEKAAFEDAAGTGKITRIVKKETSDRFDRVEKLAKRWHFILGICIAIVGGVAGVVSWKNSLAPASAVEIDKRDIAVLQQVTSQLVEEVRAHQRQHVEGESRHDAELRWLGSIVAEVKADIATLKAETDGVARATGAPVHQRGR